MAAQLSAAAVICCYSDDRWHDLTRAYASLRTQSTPPDEIVVVVDHNEGLFDRARNAFDGARVVRNDGPRGLSGARNRGLMATTGCDIVLFLDDDAVADTGWVERMAARFADESVVGVGGFAVPSWDGGVRPSWFPEEFLWVVGCSHRGLPEGDAPIRNPIGCAMAFRSSAVALAGDFSAALGRIGAKPVGCEETDLALRLVQRNPGTRVVFARDAIVRHRVTRDRQRLGYFLSRCYWEGVSKAVITTRHRGGAPLRTERRFVRTTLVGGVVDGVGSAIRGRDVASLQRAGTIAFGFVATVTGYLIGRLTAPRAGPPVASPAPTRAVAR